MSAGTRSLYHLSADLSPLAVPEPATRGGLEFSTWRPTPATLGTVAAGLIRAAFELRSFLPPERLFASLGGVAADWLDRTSPYRAAAERLLPATTGYAPDMVREALDRLFVALLPDRLAAAFRAERDRCGSSPRLVLALAAGTVFPPSIVTATATLLRGAPVLVKTASAEPVLAPLWAASLAARDPDLSRLVAVLSWPRSAADLNAAACAGADVVVAYGDTATIAAVAAALPSGRRLVAHGHKVAAAILGARALAVDLSGLARSLARAVALYDQQGCLSPHTVFVEEAAPAPQGVARAFASHLAAELALLAARWPRTRLDPATASGLRQFLGAREFAATPESALLGGLEAGYAVLLAGPDDPPHFEFSPLDRTVFVKPVGSAAEAIAALVPVREHLQAVGLAVPHRDRRALARALGLDDDIDDGVSDGVSDGVDDGVSDGVDEDIEANRGRAPRVRLCPVHALQSPPFSWPADGHRPLASLSPRPR